MKSVFLHKGSKVANCFGKIFPAVFAVNLAGCHVSNRFDAFLESRALAGLIVRFQPCGVRDELKPLGIEFTGYRHKDVGGVYLSSIGDDFGIPNSHEGQEIGLAALSGELVGTPVVSGVTPKIEQESENSSHQTATEERNYGLPRLWHFFLAALGGFIGYRGQSAFRRWRLRREERTSLEKPYSIGGNTIRLYMTYIVCCYRMGDCSSAAARQSPFPITKG